MRARTNDLEKDRGAHAGRTDSIGMGSMGLSRRRLGLAKVEGLLLQGGTLLAWSWTPRHKPLPRDNRCPFDGTQPSKISIAQQV